MGVKVHTQKCHKEKGFGKKIGLDALKNKLHLLCTGIESINLHWHFGKQFGSVKLNLHKPYTTQESRS